ncbi:glycosyltransferase family 2 protein [Mariniblastus sp.]|nr:glycosyltransferase family 2 protein [Mariniblastus sp.]
MFEWVAVLKVIGVLTAAIWCLSWCRAWWHSRQYLDIPVNILLEEEDLSGVPPLTVLIPACNEAASIESTALGLLGQTYPNLQLIFINDRSTDETGEIIDRLAVQNERITAIHIETLPDGWLGKVHALHVATAQASGEWLLYTDADVQFEPNALVELMQFAQSHEIDHLAGLPRMKPAGALIEIAIAAFYTSSMFFVSAKRVANVDDPLAVGVGALNLVRASALKQTEGFEWLKMETIDDVGLGLMMKRGGGRPLVARAGKQISLHWYQNITEMAGGLEKNSPGLTKYSLIRAIGLLAILPVTLFGFVCTLFLPAIGVVTVWAAVIMFPMLFMSAFSRQSSLSRMSFFLFPVGLAMLWFIFARALILLWSRGGVQWRGTQYGIEQLRNGQRLEL